MDRRRFLGTVGAGSLGLALGANTVWAQAATRSLPILPLTDLIDGPDGGIDGRIALSLGAGRHDFGTGAQSATMGINHSYLGPVLRVKQGQTLPFDVTNGIDETSTLHWHGLHIPGDVDGGPHQEIAPGATWSPDVPIAQRASMNWFHSHMHGKTGRQTHHGLAGVMLVEDDASLSADLPQTYGVDDFTLVLQDKTFDAAGQMTYAVTGEVFEDGFVGDTPIVNGAIAPLTQAVPAGLVRLRILNACNARFLRLSLESGPMTVIASEGGFLPSAVQTPSILMSPGERYEVLVDVGSVTSNALQVTWDRPGFLAGLFELTEQRALVTFTQNGQKGFDGTMPNRLATLAPPNRAEATKTRSFELNMDVGADLVALAVAWDNFCGNAEAMAINGQPMNMARIDEEVRKGETEIWRISADEQRHPFHIHGCSFRILSQDGGTPPAYAQGWKDMVHVNGGWSEVLIRFDYDAPKETPYMYHCHILEHEDCGMMGQFTVG